MASKAQKTFVAANEQVKQTEGQLRSAEAKRAAALSKRDSVIDDSASYAAAARDVQDLDIEIGRLRTLLDRNKEAADSAQRDVLSEELKALFTEEKSQRTAVKIAAETMARDVAKVRASKAKLDGECASLDALHQRAREVAKALGVAAPTFPRGVASAIGFAYEQALLHQLHAPEVSLTSAWFDEPDERELLRRLRDAHELPVAPASYSTEDQLRDIIADPEIYRARASEERHSAATKHLGAGARKSRFAGVFS